MVFNGAEVPALKHRDGPTTEKRIRVAGWTRLADLDQYLRPAENHETMRDLASPPTRDCERHPVPMHGSSTASARDESGDSAENCDASHTRELRSQLVKESSCN